MVSEWPRRTSARRLRHWSSRWASNASQLANRGIGTMKLQREYPTNPSAAPLSRLALVVALARASVAVAEQVGREKPAEERGPLPRPVGQDPRHQASVLVVEHRDRDLAEEGEGMDVAVDPGLGRRRRIATHEAGVAVRQVHDEEMRLLPHPADDHQRLAEIGLRIPRRMRQRHEHLAAAAQALPHMILHDRVAAGEAVLIAKPLEHPLRSVPPFAVNPSSCGRFTAAVRRYPGGTENADILRTLSREMPKCLAASRRLVPSAQASPTLRYMSTVMIPRPPQQLQEGQKWTTIAPPAARSAHRSRGRLPHRRSPLGHRALDRVAKTGDFLVAMPLHGAAGTGGRGSGDGSLRDPAHRRRRHRGSKPRTDRHPQARSIVKPNCSRDQSGLTLGQGTTRSRP